MNILNNQNNNSQQRQQRQQMNKEPREIRVFDNPFNLICRRVLDQLFYDKRLRYSMINRYISNRIYNIGNERIILDRLNIVNIPHTTIKNQTNTFMNFDFIILDSAGKYRAAEEITISIHPVENTSYGSQFHIHYEHSAGQPYYDLQIAYIRRNLNISLKPEVRNNLSRYDISIFELASDIAADFLTKIHKKYANINSELLGSYLSLYVQAQQQQQQKQNGGGHYNDTMKIINIPATIDKKSLLSLYVYIYFKYMIPIDILGLDVTKTDNDNDNDKNKVEFNIEYENIIKDDFFNFIHNELMNNIKYDDINIDVSQEVKMDMNITVGMNYGYDQIDKKELPLEEQKQEHIIPNITQQQTLISTQAGGGYYKKYLKYKQKYLMIKK